MGFLFDAKVDLKERKKRILAFIFLRFSYFTPTFYPIREIRKMCLYLFVTQSKVIEMILRALVLSDLFHNRLLPHRIKISDRFTKNI